MQNPANQTKEASLNELKRDPGSRAHHDKMKSTQASMGDALVDPANQRTLDATQLRKSQISDSNLNDGPAGEVGGRNKLVSKESYADIPERDDLDFDDDAIDNCDEETQVSPEVRQRKGEKRAYAHQSVEDAKIGLQTIKIEQ